MKRVLTLQSRKAPGGWRLGLQVAIVFCLAASLLAGCAEDEPEAPATTAPPATTAAPAPADPDAEKRGGVLQLGTPQPIQTLDPHQFGIYNNRNAWPGLYSGLTRYTEELEPVPDLAVSWEWDDSGTAWTFNLRQGVEFHNGQPFTAADVKYSLDRLLHPDTNAGVYAEAVSTIEEVEVVDDHTVILHLSAPSAILLAGLARAMIIPEGSGETIAQEGIGTGPFAMVDYVADERLIMTRNENYWEEGLPYLDGVEVTVQPDTTTLFTALSAGDVDIYWQLEPRFVQQIAKEGELRTLFAPSSSVVTYMSIYNGAPPFDDVRARQALLHALDLDTINTLAFFDTGIPVPTNNLLPPGHWAEAPGLTEYPYDLDRAKALFEEVGVTELSYVGLNIVPWTRIIGEVMEQSLGKIGIKLNVSMPELGGWSEAFTPNPAPGAIVANAALPDYDPAFLWNLAHPDVNPWGFGDERFAQLLADAAAELDLEKRIAAYVEVQEVWNAEVPTPILYFDRWFHGVRDRVQDLKHLNSGDLDYRETWLTDQ